MGYLGNNQLPFDPARSSGKPLDAQRFSGDNSTTTFTLTLPVNNPTDLEVFVENVQQEPTVAYNAIGNALTFTEAPPSGTNNIYVVYRNYGTAEVQLADGSVSYAKLANNIRQFTQDNFTANGSGQTFTLTETPASANTLMVAIDGVMQTAPVNYTVTGTTLTFTGVPPASSNVTVKHLGFRTTTTVTALTAGSVTATELADGAVTDNKLAVSPLTNILMLAGM
jgi:hypothetical protein